MAEELITSFPILGITTIMGNILIITTMNIITMMNRVKNIIKGPLVMDTTKETMSTTTKTKREGVDRTVKVLWVN